MKRAIPILFALTAMAHGTDLSALADETKQPLIATVLDFQCSAPNLGIKGAEAAKILVGQLSEEPNIIVVQKQELDKVFGAKELVETDNVVDSDVAARIGQLTGASILVAGRIIASEGNNFVVAKIVSAETGQVYGEIEKFEQSSDLEPAINRVARKIIADFNKHTGTLVVQESPANRLSRLRKIVEGRKLPTVAVEFADASQTTPAVAPTAAHEEIKQALKDVGFLVVDGTSVGQQHPQMTISARAISEVAGRRGKQISCRARVELKFSRPGTTGVVLADRQTDLAVGDAEALAGKSALATSASKLLDRIIPAIADTEEWEKQATVQTP